MTKLSISLLTMVFLVMFSMLAMRSTARVYPKISVLPSTENSRSLHISRLGFDVSKMQYHQRRFTSDATYMRVSPGGPDPQHHTQPPALVD